MHHTYARASIVICLAMCLVGWPRAAAADYRVAMGTNHALALKSDGTVWSWGGNNSGELGTGNTTARLTPGPVSGLTGTVVAIAAGEQYSLALTADGTVWSWGYNASGRLGDGTTTTRHLPVQVSGLTNITAIAAGKAHALARKSDGTVWAWGLNTSGQIGDGTTTTRTSPVQVSGLSAVETVAANGDFSLAIKNDGTVWGWGQNFYGSLGIGTTVHPKLTPTQTSTTTVLEAIGAGDKHGFAFESGGTFVGWGLNGSGQVGDGTQTQRNAPVSLSTTSAVTAIEGGNAHTVAALSDGTVWGWGYNSAGQVGDGTTTTRLSPVAIAGPDAVAVVSARQNSTIAVSDDGRIWVWGANSQGQLGDGTTTDRHAPVQISDADFEWRAATPRFNIAPGNFSSTFNVTVTTATAGAVIHYTTNGVEPTDSDPTVASGGTIPITSTTTLKAKAWFAGMPPSNVATATYTLTVPQPSISPGTGTYTSARTVTLSTSVGSTTIHYTVDGTAPSVASPVYSSPLAVSTGTTLKAIAVRTGWTTSAVATATYTFNYGVLAAPTFSPGDGQHGYGQLITLSGAPGATIRYTTNGTTPIATSPVYTAPIALTGTMTINAKAFHPDWTTSPMASASYTVKVAAPVFSLGAGTYAAGQIITITAETPSAVIHYTLDGREPTENDIVIGSGAALVAGNFTLKARAFRAGWTSSDVTSAAYAITGSVATPMVAAGSSHSVVLRDDGTVWAWGSNSTGALGDGTTITRSVPALVSGLTGATAVAAGANHVLVRTSAGLVLAWGSNTNGQVGDGTTTNRLGPTLVAALTDVVAVAAGQSFSLALKGDGTVWSWGANGSGQLGDGTTLERLEPVPVTALSGVTAIAAGATHALAWKSDGTIWAWGSNGAGQLGDGTGTQRLVPTQASLSSAAGLAVSGGGAQSFARLTDGTLWAWGANASGQLGLGFVNGWVVSPSQLPSFGSVAGISAGDLHAVAFTADGTAWSWGAGGFGRLGDGATANRATPGQIPALTDVLSVAAGHTHSLAVTADGTVWAWGANGSGQLGDGTLDTRLSPVKVSEAGFAWKTSTPRLTPGSGTYAGITSVTLTAVTPGATIHYTLNGTDPTVSDPSIASGGAVTVDQSLTLKAIAWAGAMPVSNIAAAVYAMALPAPTFSPVPGSYAESKSVTLLSSVPDTTIRYTTDGTTPTESSMVASGPIPADATTTIQAKAFRSGWTASPVATGVFTLTVVAPQLTPSGGSFGSPQAVSISTTTPGATITYTLDGSEPTVASTPYTAPVTVASTATLKATGWRTGWTGSASGAGSFWIAEGTAATPTFSPSAGSFTGPQWVTIQTTTADATIRYTVDGSEPSTSSPPYLSPLYLPVTTLLKATAFKTGYAASAAATATFAIDVAGAVATPAIEPAGGWRVSGGPVTLSVTTPTAVIRYTTTGADPGETDATVISGGTLPVTRSMVIKARAWASGSLPSAVRRSDVVVTGAVAAGDQSTYVVTGDGSVSAWGANNRGQLGNGTTTPSSAPGVVSGLSSIVGMAAGDIHALAVRSDGSVWAWGDNARGQLGDGTTTMRWTPVQVPGLTGVVAVAAGGAHSLALKADGSVWAWGANGQGQLGDGTTTDRWTPTAVPSLTGVVAIEGGHEFSLAIQTDGTTSGGLWAWGANASGQLGDGSTQRRPSPVRVTGLSQVMAVSAGLDFALALKAGGTVWAWGNNTSGQLGDTTTISRLVAVPVIGLEGMRAVTAGRHHGTAVGADGRVWSWGSNSWSQLGDNAAISQRSHAALLPGLVDGVLSIASGVTHTVAIEPSGAVKAWGSNGWGAIGDGTTTVRPTPVASSGLVVADNSWLVSDPDTDGLLTWREYVLGTDPLHWDSSGSGLGDRVLADAELAAADTDLDGDGIPNAVERVQGTDPLAADSDGDGVPDGADAFPLDPTRAQAPAADPNDHTPPVITLTEPAHAVPIP